MHDVTDPCMSTAAKFYDMEQKRGKYTRSLTLIHARTTEREIEEQRERERYTYPSTYPDRGRRKMAEVPLSRPGGAAA